MKRILIYLSIFCFAFSKAGYSSADEKTNKYVIPFPAAFNPMQNVKSPAIHAAHEISSDLKFEKNKGQWPAQVEYKSDLPGGRRVFFENDRFTYNVYNPGDLDRFHEEARSGKSIDYSARIDLHAFQMQFVNASPNVELFSEGQHSFYYNYFLGDPSTWASEVPVFSSFTYKGLYPGIDVKAYSDGVQFKYDYHILPGADAKSIQLQFAGADKIYLKNKDLCILTSVGEIIESVPYAFQRIDGREVRVACEYQIGRNGKIVSFYFPDGFDARYELIIDPVVMASTYSGSTAQNYGHCATYDASGNIYTGGRCFGTGYPVTLGAAQSTFGGNVDISVSKLNPTGSALLYATYLGGTNADLPHSMFVSTNNELFVYGSSMSSNYPVTTGAYDGTANGSYDMIITKLNVSGTVLLGSTFVGGTNDDAINNLASYNYGDNYRGEIIVDTGGDVYVAGTTASANFPATTGAYDVTHNGGQDAVLLKLNNSLTTLQWATFLGSSLHEAGCGLRRNQSGEIYMVGLTQGGNFPSTTGVINSTYQGGAYDGFIARFNSSGTTLMNSTFIGTAQRDINYFIDIDIYNDIYIYGICEGSLPVTPGVYTNPNSQTFLAKINPVLSSILYCTVLGGGTHALFSPSALMVDVCLNVYISGWGTNTNFPVTPNAAQSAPPGGFHLMVLNGTFSTLLYGSFYGSGGEHVDGGTSRFDPNGIVYQAVCSCNATFPTLSTCYAPSKLTSGCDIAVFKINFQTNCVGLTSNTIICHGQSATINLLNMNNLSNPTYSYLPGGATTNTLITVSPTVTTNYTLYINGINSFNVPVTNTGVATVSVVPQPVVTPTITQASCVSTLTAFDLGLSFLPVNSAPSYSVVWSVIPFGVTSATQTSASGSLVAGPYQATVTAPNGCSATANFTINPAPTTVSFNVIGPFNVTCANPVITVSLVPTTNNYFWAGNTATFTGSSATFSAGNTGTWVVTGTDPQSGCVGTRSFVITKDLTVSTSTVAPLSQNINCTLTSAITVTATGSPSVNVTHYWLSPFGGTLIAYNAVTMYSPTAPGTYTHVLINNVNGCFVEKTFTVFASPGFPTFSLTSPQNFTLGCSTKSIATINIVGGQTDPPGGPVSYTILGPSSNTAYVTGAISSYTNITLPGTYTVITKDNTNFCETKVPISVLQNTLAPDLLVSTARTILTCDFPTTVLHGQSITSNVLYNWSFPGVPGNQPGDSIRVNVTGISTSSIIANYTLTITDNNNACKSSTVVLMLQNTYLPKPVITGAMPITCKTPSVTLTNSSSGTIPDFFVHPLPVVGYIWRGPSPEQPLQFSSTYVGWTPGVYSLTVKDLNNGCTATQTTLIEDFRDYPTVNNPNAPPPFPFDCAANGATIYPIITSPLTNLSYEWVAVHSTSFSTMSQATTIVNNTGAFNILVTNTLNGCQSSGFVDVIRGELDAKFIAEPIQGFAPMAVTFTNLSSSTSTVTGKQGITSTWSFGNGIFLSPVAGSVNPSTKYTQPGNYTVTLFVDKGDCQDSTFIVLRVDLPSQLIIPNVFTPNGDGKNDLFFVRATNLAKISAVIDDRWGNNVYELTSGSGNIEWNGRNQAGMDVSEGVYFYVIKATGTDGEEYEKTGTVTLIR